MTCHSFVARPPSPATSSPLCAISIANIDCKNDMATIDGLQETIGAADAAGEWKKQQNERKRQLKGVC